MENIKMNKNKPSYRVYANSYDSDLSDFVDNLTPQSIVGVDVETDGLGYDEQLVSIQVYDNVQQRGIYFPLNVKGEGNVSSLLISLALNSIIDKKPILSFHNITFDVGFLMKYIFKGCRLMGVFDTTRMIDTSTLATMCQVEGFHDLKLKGLSQYFELNSPFLDDAPSFTDMIFDLAEPSLQRDYVLMTEKKTTKAGKAAKLRWDEACRSSNFGLSDTTFMDYAMSDAYYSSTLPSLLLDYLTEAGQSAYDDYTIEDAYAQIFLQVQVDLRLFQSTIEGYPIDKSALVELTESVEKEASESTERLVMMIRSDIVDYSKGYDSFNCPDPKKYKFLTTNKKALREKYSTVNPKFEKEIVAITPNSRAVNHWIYNILLPDLKVNEAKCPSISAPTLEGLCFDKDLDEDVKDKLRLIIETKSLIHGAKSISGAASKVYSGGNYPLGAAQ